MKNVKPMKENSLRFIVLLFIIFPFTIVAQDAIPEKAVVDHNSGPIYSSSAMQNLMRYIPISNPMPSLFKDTLDNTIDDPDRSLDMFWNKISEMKEQIRIVHLGDSHVRGHIFPYVMRKLLEEDFGNDAVIDYAVDYRTSGLATETGRAGIVYHIIGENGATCRSFNKPDRISEITSLNPDLIIMSFGTNEAHSRNYSSREHISDMSCLIKALKEKCINASFLITTPPGAYTRKGRSKIVNTRTPVVVNTAREFAQKNGMAIWDLYDIVGGEKCACKNWSKAGMYQKDKIHFTREGYTLQGLLFHEAFIKAYNDYVSTKLN